MLLTTKILSFYLGPEKTLEHALKQTGSPDEKTLVHQEAQTFFKQSGELLRPSYIELVKAFDQIQNQLSASDRYAMRKSIQDVEWNLYALENGKFRQNTTDKYEPPFVLENS